MDFGLESILMNQKKTTISLYDIFCSRRCVRNVFAEFSSFVNLIRQNHIQKHRHDKIRVCFIVQMIELWDKQKPVYDAMKRDSDFDVSMFVVPPYDKSEGECLKVLDDNIFISIYPEAIRAWGGNEWIDISGFSFDYVFFQRPYDDFLPRPYRSQNVIRYSKCCYVPYGFPGADVFNDGNTNRSFFRNTYYVFNESDQMMNLLNTKYRFTRKFHHFVSLGYPALLESYSISASGSYSRITWTPRWSYDEKYGGSNFLEYKDILLGLSSDDRVKIRFRPHPLMFDELQIKGLFSVSEKNDYLESLTDHGIIYDCNSDLIKTFSHTDILITDYSTVIIEFFVTGRPVIYCDKGIELNEVYKRLIDGLYVAHNDIELKGYINDLLNGNDYLFETRKKIISELMKDHINSVDNILNEIRSDYFGKYMR